jgi:N-methylhydantoinase A/oxoprolinase/acetone carboxylase beta subunit
METPDVDRSQKPIHVIACGVLAIDIRHLARRLGIAATMEFLPGGLHDRPDELRRRVQEEIDRASATLRAERIIVGYGVCGLGTVGLHARNVPLAIPRVNDCIALFLGSDAAYREQFSQYPGTYYISAGWVEEKTQPQSTEESPIHCGPECFTLQQLIKRYGQENATAIRDFLNSWQKNYQRAVFIDTAAPGRRRKYADLAKAMADEFGWKYEEIAGSDELLTNLITARQSTEEVLLVPEHYVTAHDPVTKTLKAVPVWESDRTASRGDHTLIFASEAPSGDSESDSAVGLGLGIDAGGTYTDVVLYDFKSDRVLEKAKSLTTKWDFTIGIGEALDKLDSALLARVDLVSISTTLATNAIVEGRGQKVGLLIFPPYGLFKSSDITFRPISILEGKLEVDGRELAPVNRELVRREVRRLLDEEQVAAFAVSGFGSHSNAAHELEAKEIVERESRLSVTCAHEVSEKSNYRIRSVTAALNASIIPCLEAFLGDVDLALRGRAITAPRVVVRSDGTLMSLPLARRRPIETILSGPAASVAGASYLAGLENAMVVDMGGTTTDTATIRKGVVQICRGGASVGGWRTHVGALDLRTTGLGGDSLIARRRDGRLHIGPVRVAPVAWMYRDGCNGERALDWLDANLDRFRTSTRGMELVALTNVNLSARLSERETRLLDVLSDGPCSIHELSHRLDMGTWRYLPLERLEQRYLVQRSALTPTDLLHVVGRLELWNADASRRFCDFFCRLLDVPHREFARIVHDMIVRRLAVELLKKQLAEQTDADDPEVSMPASALTDNWLCGGNDDYRVRIALEYPIVGIGAPAHIYLPDVAKRFDTKAIIPPEADVANAIGAITSRVFIQKNVEIAPAEHGQYLVSGLPDAPAFADFHDALQFATGTLTRTMREQAKEAGTSETRVEILVHDRVAPVADGSQIFIARNLTARLSGRPDIARLSEAGAS